MHKSDSISLLYVSIYNNNINTDIENIYVKLRYSAKSPQRDLLI